MNSSGVRTSSLSSWLRHCSCSRYFILVSAAADTDLLGNAALPNDRAVAASMRHGDGGCTAFTSAVAALTTFAEKFSLFLGCTIEATPLICGTLGGLS